MKKIFYDKDGIVGMITYLGKNEYYFEVTRENGEKLLSKTTSGQGVIHSIHSLDHQMKTKAELTDEEWTLLTEKFPWFAEHGLEVKEVLRRFLSGLLLYTVREERKDFAELLLQKCSLDQKGIEMREIQEAAILEADCLEDNETMLVELQPFKGRNIYGSWKKGSRYVMKENHCYRISGSLERLLSLRMEKLKQLQNNYKQKDEQFISVPLVDLGIQIAFRPWKESKAGKKVYEFLVLKKSKPIFQRSVCDAPGFMYSLLAKENNTGEKRTIMSQAAVCGDRYMELLMKHFLGEATEDECEILFREDGMPHFIAGITERKVGKMEILDCQRFGGGFFRRRERYFMKVRVDGNEDEICWFPTDPGHFLMDVYHHQEDCILDKEQVEYLRTVTLRINNSEKHPT